MASSLEVDANKAHFVDLSKKPSSVVQQAMKDYWTKWSQERGTSLELMVTESDREFSLEIDRLERAEIFSHVPDMTNIDVLELGSGAGRHTAELAKRCKTLVATDFMESFVKTNEETNGPKYPNVTFRVLDATQVDYPPNTFGLIYSNWLMVYFNDEDFMKYPENTLKMVKPGGYVFIRETCFRYVGSCYQAENPPIYRSMRAHRDSFCKARYTDEHGNTFRFELIFCGNLACYVKLKQHPAQTYWLWQKVKETEAPFIDFQIQLDSTVFSSSSLEVYEKVIGDGFTTHGGLSLAKNLLSRISLPPNSSLLEVGIGMGGVMNYYGHDEQSIDVVGLEVSLNAAEQAVLSMDNKKLSRGQIHIEEFSKMLLSKGCFDGIYSSETVQYLADKAEVLKNLKMCLKSGGSLVLADVCTKDSELSNSTEEFIIKEKLKLINSTSYTKLLEDAGFTGITSEKITDQYIEYLQQDIECLKSLQELSDSVKQSFIIKWQSLLQALKNGEISFTVFICQNS